VTYNELRHLADSWGLVMMVVMFATFVGWTYRRGANARLNEAAMLIFKDGADEKAD
jgi:cytochrome c oxidase cbb3-type subunit 4